MAYLALDLGAGSGRAIVGTIKDGRIHLDEVHRFDNNPVQMGDTLYWDFLALFRNIKVGIRLAVAKGYTLSGIAVDTWGVDYGLIDNRGKLLTNPVAYRDARTRGLSDSSTKKITKQEFYSSTGIQQMEINTVFQLLSQRMTEDKTLDIAEKLLFTPDLINYFLTGKTVNEYTIASTSQLMDAKARAWDKSIFEKLDLPIHLMQEIVHSGTLIGTLTKEIADKTGAKNVPVYAVGSHDTASAIAAIPMSDEHTAFLSSGTWSLLGVLSDEPVLTEEAMLNDFTNEGGVDNKILFMRNITGLWLLQQLIEEWEKEDGKTYDYEYLLSESAKAKSFRSIVNSDDASFSFPNSMQTAIQDYCKKTKQIVPQTKGELVRCVLESLAIKYAQVLNKLEECTGKKIKQISIVGGGSKNKQLNQYIANSLNLEVVTGLTEGTALGNIMQQAIASKAVTNWEEAHDIIKNSFNFESYSPQDHESWQEYFAKTNHLFQT